MNVSAAMTPLLAQLWYLLPLLLIKAQWCKSMMSEGLINLRIRLFLNLREYHLLKDVMLSTAQGSTQIDLVIASRLLILIINSNIDTWISNHLFKIKYWHGSLHFKINLLDYINHIYNFIRSQVRLNYKTISAFLK